MEEEKQRIDEPDPSPSSDLFGWITLVLAPLWLLVKLLSEILAYKGG